ncbi:MAG: MBL fold metallo-hydrolase [Gammaproteobacteria bacterium]|nr:MAG: MBL fold metallo-hydrolase [Gammaproteobacteria bacterium]
MGELSYPFTHSPQPGASVEIAPGVRWLRMPMPGSLDHINLYVLEDASGWTLVDMGLGDEPTRELWEALFAGELSGRPVQRLLATHMHPDHIGQAGYLSERFQVPLHMTRGEYFQARAFSAGGHFGSMSWESAAFYRGAGLQPEDLEAMRRNFSGGFGSSITPLPTGYHRLRHGDSLTIGGRDWQVLVGSGHSPEHACLYCRQLGILIAGDQVLPVITSNVSVHPTEPEANPLKDWLDSHDRFLSLPDETLVLPAHGNPFRGLRKRLRALIAHHEDRMLALEEHCITPAIARDMLPVLFRRKLDTRQMIMALGECIAHLHLLMHRDRIERITGEDGVWRFRSIDPDLERRLRAEHDAPDDGPMMV